MPMLPKNAPCSQTSSSIIEISISRFMAIGVPAIIRLSLRYSATDIDSGDVPYTSAEDRMLCPQQEIENAGPYLICFSIVISPYSP